MSLYDIQHLPEDDEDLNAPPPEHQTVPVDIHPTAWDDEIPVPGNLNLRCHGCGYDLTNLSERTCPECGRPFHLPVPESFELHCAECDYLLTGLTTRICPECGTGFDVKSLLFARRQGYRNPLAHRWPWDEIISYGVGAVGFMLGVGLMSGFNLKVFVVCLLLTAGPVVVATMRGADWHVSILWAGLIWGFWGVLMIMFL